MADLAELKIAVDTSDLARAGGEAAAFGDQVAATNEKVAASTASASASYKTYAQQVTEAYGLTDTVTNAQSRVIRGLEDQIAAIKLSGAQLTQYTALRKAGTTADTEAGAVISRLAAQYATLSAAQTAANAAAKETAFAHGLAAAETEGLGEASHRTAEALHVLHPALKDAGLAGGELGSYARLARAGVELLAVALAGAFVVALDKAADETQILQARLKALLPAGHDAEHAFEMLEQTSQKTGTAISTTAGAFETLTLAASRFRQNIVVAPGGNADLLTQWGLGSAAFNRALQSLNELFQMAGLDASKAKGAMEEFAKSISAIDPVTKQAIGLTAQEFDKLQEIAPNAATAIMKAFNRNDPILFRQELERHPAAFREVIKALNAMGQTVDAEFGKMPKTVQKASDQIKADWEQMLDRIGGTGLTQKFLGVVDQMVIDFGIGFKAIAEAAEKGGAELPELIAHGIGFAIQKEFEIAKAAADWYLDTIRSIFASVPGIIKDAFGAAVDWVTDKFKAFFDWLSGAISSAVSALQSMMNSATKAEADMSAGAIGAGSPDTTANISIGSNAAGGIYAVSGSGGEDSLNITGRVSPGETVAVLPRGTASSSLLVALQQAIGGSPISVSPSGSSAASLDSMATPDSQSVAPAASATIAAPTSYAAYEASGITSGGTTTTRAATAAVATASQAARGAAVPASGISRSASGASNPWANDTWDQFLPDPNFYQFIDGVRYTHWMPNPNYQGGGGAPGGASLGGGVTSHVSGVGQPFTDPASSLEAQLAKIDAQFGFGGGGATSAAASSAARGSRAAAPPPQMQPPGTGWGNPALHPQSNGGGGGPRASNLKAPGEGETNLPVLPHGTPAGLPSYDNPAGIQGMFDSVFGSLFGQVPGSAGLDFGSNAASDNVSSAMADALGINDIGGSNMASSEEIAGNAASSLADELGINEIGAASDAFAGGESGGDMADALPSDWAGNAGAAAAKGGGSSDEDWEAGNIDAGDFATGGGFEVPHIGAGVDRVRTMMHLSPGERVSVQSGNGDQDSQRIGPQGKGGGGDIHMHFHGVQDMGSFSAPQSRLAMQRWARGALQ